MKLMHGNYILFLLNNIMLLQDIETLSSEASQLIPQHNYKLDVHALNSRRPGEVWLDWQIKFVNM